MTTELKLAPVWYNKIKSNRASSRLFEYAISNPNCSLIKGLLYRNYSIPMNIEFKNITDIFRTIIKTLDGNSLSEKVKFSSNSARGYDAFIHYCVVHDKSKNRESFYSSVGRYPVRRPTEPQQNTDNINSIGIELDDFEGSWNRSWTNISSTETCYSTSLELSLISVLENLESNDLDLSNTLDELDEVCRNELRETSPDDVHDEEYNNDYAEIEEEWNYDVRFNNKELFYSTIDILKQIRDSGNQNRIADVMSIFSRDTATDINELIDKLSEAVENQL